MNKEQAFIKILEESQQRIQKICAMYTATPEDCKDLVQEVILTIWKAYPTFKGQSAINTWIFGFIFNRNRRNSSLCNHLFCSGNHYVYWYLSLKPKSCSGKYESID